MKVYLTHYDNMEPWEDNFHDISGVFETREKAVASVEAKGYVTTDNKHWHFEEEDDFYNPEYTIEEWDVQ